jgi:tRNA pseudouridine55 synthase
LGLSSNIALQKVKRLYQAAKAGHTGSLDPLATGLLPICLGQATKLSGWLLDADKRYQVWASVGTRTTTADAEGEVIQTSDPARLTREALEACLPRFTGEILQRPPMHSALKHQGRRLYELAREGQSVERAERPIRIDELRLTGFQPGGFGLDVRCSKGTYIRTLVEDLAEAAGQCAHVSALRRLEVEPFDSTRMLTLDSLEQAAARGLEVLDALLLEPAVALAGWPRVSVDADRAFYLSRGQPVRVADAPREGALAVLGPDGRLLGIAEISPDGLVAPRRWMA